MGTRTSDEDLNRAVGERLRLTREALGLSQNDFASRAGIAANTYSQCENGKRSLAITKAIALCEAHGLTLDWLYRDDPGNLAYKLAAAIKALRDMR